MARIYTTLPRVLLAVITILLLGCGGGNNISQLASGDPTIPGIQAPVQAPAQGAWPSALPLDYAQPWEELDGAGNVVPAEHDYFGGKAAAAVNPDSQFAAGVECEGSCTSVVENGEALTVISGAGGYTDPAFAWYRLTLGGVEPGVVSCDVNPLPGVENMSEYWVGLADYGNSRWEWHGPYSDHHVRIETASAVAGGASYLSSFGNLFVAVVVHGGDSCDVVGISANPIEAADTEAPPQPTGLTLTPVAHGLELSWNDVVDGGLAGYRVYYAEQWFYNGMSAGAHWLEELEGTTRYLLSGVEGITYVRIGAVDLSGNESELSEIEYGTPLSGDAPALELTVSQPSGYLDDAVSLSASGAESYDWDVNGDGVYDITGNPSGSASVDTSSTGIIRPSVRGTSSGGTMVACGGVSVIITGNSRPVASAIANPQSGDAPLSVTFTGTAEDTEDDAGSLTYAWDFDGDGAYEAGTDTLTPAPQEYTTVGVYGVKFRVEDSGGAWDVDTVAVQVLPAPDPDNVAPTAVLTIGTGEESGDTPHTVNFDAGGSSDPDAGDSIVEYHWDFDGDGMYDGMTTTATYTFTYTAPGIFDAEVMVQDSHGATDTATVEITVNVAGNDAPVADVTATPDSGDTPLDVTLNAGGSTDSDGSIVNYEWDFDGNGTYDTYGSVDSVDHTYTAAGIFTAKVRVTDDAGAQDTDTAVVTVNVPGNDTPTADLAPPTSSGDLPHTVNFDAGGSSDPDGSIVLYEWDFDGDGNYDGYGDDATIDHTYTVAGVYTAKLRATDDVGAQDTDTSEITVNVPGNDSPTADVSASPDYGATPLEVDFDATGSSDSDGAIVRYDWDFDGDGNYELYDGGGSPTWTYNTYGSHTAKLRVTDDDGAQATDTVGISAYSWALCAADEAGDVGRFTSLAKINGSPAISYYDATNDDLKYVRAANASGSAWGTPVTVDSTGDVGWYTSLRVVNGNPAISYYDSTNGDLKYVRAHDTSGSSWGTPVTVASTDDVGVCACMILANGNPAIGYYDSTNYDLKYVRADDADGSTWGTVQTPDSSGMVGNYLSARVVNGNPAISYYDNSNNRLKYVRASNADGSSWNAPVTVDSTADVGIDTCLIVVSGNPAISYKDWSNKNLKYVRASNANGGSWNTPVTVASAGDVGSASSLRTVNGMPAISYLDSTNADLKYVRATDATGSTWAAPITVDSTGNVGYMTSMIGIGGQPAISYYDDTKQNLKLAAGSF